MKYNISRFRSEATRKHLAEMQFPAWLIKRMTSASPYYYLLKLLGICRNYPLFVTKAETGEICGAVLLRRRLRMIRRGYAWRIHCLYVRPEMRGSGLGTLILRHILRILEKWRVKEVSLNVAKDNQRAKDLYEEMGFVESHRNWKRVLMSKTIDATRTPEQAQKQREALKKVRFVCGRP